MAEMPVAGGTTAVPAQQTPPLSTLAANNAPRLIDRFGRVHRSLRVSVIDACNIRCQYCMPAEGVQFLPQQQLLSFEQIEAFVRYQRGDIGRR